MTSRDVSWLDATSGFWALANHSRYLLFARQTRGGGGAMTCAWRSLSQRWIVARYCNALRFGVTTRVTRYILPKVTLSVTAYFNRNYKCIMVSMLVELSLIDNILDSSFA